MLHTQWLLSLFDHAKDYCSIESWWQWFWIIGLNAIGANMYVTLAKGWWKGKMRELKRFCSAILHCLISLLAIIASADIYFGEYFRKLAEAWISGITCRISGALSVTSSEASVLFIVLITIEIITNIRFPYSQYKLWKRPSTVTAVLVWLISITFGTIPSILVGQRNTFYDNSHVCIDLPLANIQHFA